MLCIQLGTVGLVAKLANLGLSLAQLSPSFLPIIIKSELYNLEICTTMCQIMGISDGPKVLAPTFHTF